MRGQQICKCIASQKLSLLQLQSCLTLTRSLQLLPLVRQDGLLNGAFGQKANDACWLCLTCVSRRGS